MKQWTRHISSMTMEEIAVAVNNSRWQSFRRSLKGLPTEEKLQKLETYMRRAELQNGNVPRMEIVRVDNYINALKRGGQLDSEGRVVR